MVVRSEYEVSLVINGRHFRRIVIDPHYKERHSELSDELIVKLVKKISGSFFRVEKQDKYFEYFKVEPVFLDFSPYRLIFLLSKRDDFVGIVNAFRVRRKK